MINTHTGRVVVQITTDFQSANTAETRADGMLGIQLQARTKNVKWQVGCFYVPGLANSRKICTHRVLDNCVAEEFGFKCMFVVEGKLLQNTVPVSGKKRFLCYLRFNKMTRFRVGSITILNTRRCCGRIMVESTFYGLVISGYNFMTNRPKNRWAKQRQTRLPIPTRIGVEDPLPLPNERLGHNITVKLVMKARGDCPKRLNSSG